MKYRITEGVNRPFRVLLTIKELSRTRMEVNAKVKSVFAAKMFALGVVIKILVPKQTAKTSFQVTSGRAKYSPSIDCLVWKKLFLYGSHVHCIWIACSFPQGEEPDQ